MVKNKYRKPHKVKRKRPFFKKKVFWILVATVLIVGELVFLVCFCSFFKTREIKIIGNEKVPKQKISSLVWDKIERNLYFWSSKSIILASTGDLKNGLKQSYPYIEEVNINRSFPDILNVEIKERTPDFIWCTKNNCFKADKNGIIFDKAEKNRELALIIDKTKNEIISLGTKVIKQKNLENIFKIKERVKEYNIPINSFIIEKDRLIIKTKKSWEIYFDLNKDIEWQLTKLKADLEKEIPKEKREDLKYIELRFGNFAPYKYK